MATMWSVDQLSSPTGMLHLVEFICTRQKRVVRSTFSAETNGLIDALEKVFPIQTAYHQLLCGSEETAAQLAELLDAGSMVPGIEAGVDARGV